MEILAGLTCGPTIYSPKAEVASFMTSPKPCYLKRSHSTQRWNHMLHVCHLTWNIAMPFQQLLIGVIGITNWKTSTQLSCDKGYVNGSDIYDDNVRYSNISWHLGGRKCAVVNPILSLSTSMNKTCDWRGALMHCDVPVSWNSSCFRNTPQMYQNSRGK